MIIYVTGCILALLIMLSFFAWRLVEEQENELDIIAYMAYIIILSLFSWVTIVVIAIMLVFQFIKNKRYKKIKNHKIKKFNYPFCKRNKLNGCIVEFKGLNDGIVIEDTEASRRIGQNVGHISKHWIEHIDTFVWEDISCNKES